MRISTIQSPFTTQVDVPGAHDTASEIAFGDRDLCRKRVRSLNLRRQTGEIRPGKGA